MCLFKAPKAPPPPPPPPTPASKQEEELYERRRRGRRVGQAPPSLFALTEGLNQNLTPQKTLLGG
jgi:hypothetical protein